MVRSTFDTACLAVLLLAGTAGGALAQTKPQETKPQETTAQATKPGEIKGMDVMGDKSRSATDGWVQAPIPREKSAAKDAPDPGGQSTEQNADRPVPKADTNYTPGSDPQGPLEHRTAAPAVDNPAQPTK